MTTYTFLMQHKDGRYERITREFPGGYVGAAVSDAKFTARANKAKLVKDEIGAIVTFNNVSTPDPVALDAICGTEVK